MALASNSARWGRGFAPVASLDKCWCCKLLFSRALFSRALCSSVLAIWGKTATESNSRVKSLGRAERRATLVRIRSISPTCLRWPFKDS